MSAQESDQWPFFPLPLWGLWQFCIPDGFTCDIFPFPFCFLLFQPHLPHLATHAPPARCYYLNDFKPVHEHHHSKQWGQTLSENVQHQYLFSTLKTTLKILFSLNMRTDFLPTYPWDLLYLWQVTTKTSSGRSFIPTSCPTSFQSNHPVGAYYKDTESLGEPF